MPVFERIRRVRGIRSASVDTKVRIGTVTLPNPVMPASGTAGHSTELSAYLDLSKLGAFVTKSLAHFPWEGNPAPRVHSNGAAMINSVGLQGPGVGQWLDDGYLKLRQANVERIVVSIWGRNAEDYQTAAKMLSECDDDVVAVEINLSCPNLDGGKHLFAHDAEVSAEVVERCGIAQRPVWAKLSPNTDRLVAVAGAVRQAGAEAVTLTNTLLGMMIDVDRRVPVLGGGGGGVSGAAIHPVAVRAVYDCAGEHPDLPIIGVGGISCARDAVEFVLAGASAVQVGTASFGNPRACQSVLDGMVEWCEQHQVTSISELCGGANDRINSDRR